MAINYKLKNSASIGAVPVALYTVPASTVALVHSLIIANRTAGEILVDVQITDTSAAITTYLVKSAPIPAAGAIIPLGDNNKQALEVGDIITITSNTATSADATLSVMEEGI